MKKVINHLAMALACLSMVLTACQKPDVSYVTIEEMYFNQAVPTFVDEGQEVNLSSYLMILPVTVADTVSVTWNSSNEEIATVNANGTVQALREGNVTITANAQDKFASLTLRIDKVKITEFTIPAKFEVYVGSKAKFPITDVKPKGTPLHRFKWEADNDGKKPTYSEGSWYLKADEEREYTLTASVDDADDAKCQVKFVKPSVNKLAFNPASYTAEAESSLSLKTNLEITAADGFKADTIKVTWSSSKESVATIDQNGKVQAVSAGKATITANAGGKTATCTVTVTAKPGTENPDTPIDPSDPSDPSDPENPIITQYTVSYNANGGTGSMSSVTVKENESITIANNLFSRPMYEFIGWNTKANGSGTAYQSGASLVVTENITLYAQWQDMANGYEYVDLGLSVMWAVHNVGTTSSWLSGDYYAWGETETKFDYSSQTHEKSWVARDLFYDEDAARVKMGGKWRMPTKTEMQELRNNCDWDWTINGVEGYKVTSKLNGKSIFLPAVGYKSGTSTRDYGVEGNYYTSSSPQDVIYRGVAWAMCFDDSSRDVTTVWGGVGFSVRAVLPK